jgi:hypothetical protein
MNLRCPYLKTHVELTDERETHIREKHSELLPQYRDHIDQTLADPDEVRRDARFPNSVVFSHWFPDVKAVSLLSWWWSLIPLPQIGIGSSPRMWLGNSQEEL